MKKLFSYIFLVGALNAAPKPNILFIMVDDMGRDWISCYGAKHSTPNIDQLAQDGVRYTTAWCTPICTPTRVTLLTGQYPFHHGWVQHYDVPRWGGAGLKPDQFTTFARLLRDAGYSTAIGGKWQINHLGQQPGILKEHGFEEHCVWPGVEDGQPETEPRYWNGMIQTNGKRSIVPYGPDAINAFLIDFMKRQRSKPFLIYYPMLLTHGPHTSTPLNKDDPPEGKPALYAGNVTYMDHLVGQLLQAMDNLGLRENTMVVFTGDNGSASSGVLNNEPYPKGKGRKADWGAHVPFIVRAPFLNKGNQVSKDLVDFTDLYPTFLDVAGVSVSKELKLDGRSMLPSLQGSDDPFDRRSWIYSQLGDFRMIRDWYHILDSDGSFHNLIQDPRQERPVNPQDKVAPGRRKRLQMILDRLHKQQTPPFPEFKERHPTFFQSLK